MNLFFRRLWVILTTLGTSGNGALDRAYALAYRVWFTDQDMFMHMTNSRYLSFSDLARLNLLRRTGMMKELKRNGWHLEICGQTRTITRMLKAPQAFQMICKIGGWSDTHIAFSHTFKRRGTIHAAVSTLMQITDATGTVISPQKLIDGLQWTEPSPGMSDIFIDLAGELAATTA